MREYILGLLATSVLFFGSVSVVSAQNSPHLPSERHVFANEIKEDIRELRDMVLDLREILRSVRLER